MCSPTLPDTLSAFSWDDPQIPWRQAGKADASKACFLAANEFKEARPLIAVPPSVGGSERPTRGAGPRADQYGEVLQGDPPFSIVSHARGLCRSLSARGYFPHGLIDTFAGAVHLVHTRCG
jgi:hypothetical protein